MIMKLVRDKIPDIVREKGETASFRTATADEYHRALVDKLLEECNEFKRTQSAEELADVLEVVHALAEDHGGVEAIEQARIAKKPERGGFTKRILLE